MNPSFCHLDLSFVPEMRSFLVLGLDGTYVSNSHYHYQLSICLFLEKVFSHPSTYLEIWLFRSIFADGLNVSCHIWIFTTLYQIHGLKNIFFQEAGCPFNLLIVYIPKQNLGDWFNPAGYPVFSYLFLWYPKDYLDQCSGMLCLFVVSS